MKQISSRQTFWVKRVFPVVWFGILSLVSTGFLFAAGQDKSLVPALALVVPVLMAVFGYFLFRHLIFDLADEVDDEGDALVVRNNGETVRVALADIINVDSTPFINPPRIVLTLRNETQFGRKIAFSPKRPFTFNPFATNPVADDLIDRVDKARRRGNIDRM